LEGARDDRWEAAAAVIGIGEGDGLPSDWSSGPPFSRSRLTRGPGAAEDGSRVPLEESLLDWAQENQSEVLREFRCEES
jgi:hypothetical protein